MPAAPPPSAPPSPAAPPPAAARRRRPPAGPLLLAAALLLAGLTLADARGDRRRRAEVDHHLAALALPGAAGAALAAADREDDPAHRRLAIARAVVAAEAEAAGDGEAAEAAVARLAAARELAAEAVAARPAAWEAPLFLGAATYLGRRRAGDPRVVTEAAAWELPLARARVLAPTAGEPASFSAVAYLDLWPVLSAEKRELARGLLAAAFRDERARARLLGPWLDRVEDAGEALAVLPADQPAAWRQAEEAYAARGDWAAAIEARRRGRRALVADLARRIEEAAAPGRNDDDARRRLLAALADAPPETLFLPLVERALAVLPPGAAADEASRGARAWLEWSLDLALAGRPPVAPPLVDRLAALAGELPPPLAARAALAAGRPQEARRLERIAAAPGDEAWAAYWLATARHRLDRDDPAAAAEALARVDARWRRHPLHDALALRLATAGGQEAAAREASRRLAAAGGAAAPLPGAPAGAGPARFALFLAAPAPEIVLEVAERQPTALVEVHLDGRLLDVLRARPGRPRRAAGEVAAGLHVVELRPGAGPLPRIDRLAAGP